MSPRLTRRILLRGCTGGVLGLAGSALLTACGGAAGTTIGSSSVAVTASLTTATVAQSSTAASSASSAATATTSSTAAATATTTAAPKTTSAASAASTSSAAVIAPPTTANTIWWFATNGLAKEEQDAWDGIFAQFQKENGKLKVQFTNGDNDKFTAAVAGGTYPDVHEPVTKELPSWVAKQADIDMTSYVQKAKINADDYTASQLKKVIFNGKWYGIPWDTAPAVIYYNKSLFQKAGVAEPPKKWGDPNWTWDAFLQAAQRTTTGSSADATFGYSQTNWWVYYNPWAWSNGGDFSNQDRSKITVTDSAYSDAYQWYADLRNVHSVAPTPDQAKQATWNNGKVAMMSTGSYGSVGMDQRMKSTDWDVAPYPTGKNGVFTRAPGDCCCIVNHAPHPDDGMTALLFVTGPTGQKMLAQAGYVPVLKSAQQSPEFLQPTGHVTRQVFIDGLAISRPTPVPYIYPDVNTAFGKVMDNLLAGKVTAKDLMQQLQPQFQTLLDKAPPEWRSVD
ncbi:MAG: ABC transporter substrate-binding protein [Chloroflexota bacterium]